jgi:transcriptional regulator with XRE-family HTH domain
MMAACPAPRRRPRSRKLRVSREQLTIVRAVAARGRARRQCIPDGHPGALSWELTPWTDDDAAWFVTSVHPGGLTQEQVAAAMGISRVRVSHLECEALEKLRIGFAAILAQFPLSALELELGIALEPEDCLLGMFELFDRHRRAEARAAAGLIRAAAAPYDPEPRTQSHHPQSP